MRLVPNEFFFFTHKRYCNLVYNWLQTRKELGNVIWNIPRRIDNKHVNCSMKAVVKIWMNVESWDQWFTTLSIPPKINVTTITKEPGGISSYVWKLVLNAAPHIRRNVIKNGRFLRQCSMPKKLSPLEVRL